MRPQLVAIALALLASTACGSSGDTTDAARSPAPRVAPTEEPEENFEEAPRPAAEPPGGSGEAAAKACDALSHVDDSPSPEDYLRSLASQARADRVQFARLLTLLHRAYVKGDVEKARGYIDRLSGICEDVDERRNF